MIKIIKQLVDKETPYLFSLSMGCDSLSAFLWMKNKGYNVIPIHFNHKLRPQNDLMEEKFHEICEKCGVKGYSSNSYVSNFSSDSTSRTESDFRKMRLEFYKRVTFLASAHYYTKDETPTVLTAHHLNDYVESYLLNCFRGHPNHTPIELVSRFNPLNINEVEYKIVHPFLLTTKRDFRQYLERNFLTKYVVEDETNKISKGSRRNWIRNNIIPEMKKNKLSLEKFAKRKIMKDLQLQSFVVE